MRKLLLITLPLLLIVGCSKEPINYETTLIERDDRFYTKETNKPYSGPVFSLYDDRKKKEEGSLKDGKMISKTEWEWYSNGQKKFERTYKDGKLDGLITEWYENGQKSYKVTYKDGNLSGEWTYYHRDGTKIEPIVFDNEIIYKENIFFNKDTDIPYSGRVLTVYENGQKEWEVTYKDGKEDGLVTQWYENGKKQLEVTFKDGGPDGLWTLWYENGKKKEEKTFKDGEEIFKKEWNEDGFVKE